MSACIVGTSKCRLDVWQPKIYNATSSVWYVPEKWVTCETNDDYTTNQRRSNAVTFLEIHDEIGAPRSAKISLSNRSQDFRDTSGTYTYVYNDSDGNAAYTAGIAKKHGVLNNFFYEFAYVRIVELESHMVLFAGRIYKINKKYENSTGSLVEIECFDGLKELTNISPRNLGRGFGFETPRRSDIVQGILNVGFNYNNAKPDGGPIKVRAISLRAPLTTGNMRSDDNSESDAQNHYSRFERSLTTCAEDIMWRPDKTGAPNILSEITRFAIAEPHENETADDQFGYDFFVDPNMYSANLAANIAPRSPHFNYFKRGNRLSAYSGGTGLPGTYGLTVLLPIRGQVDIAVGHKTDEQPNPDTVQYATKVMQGGAFDFESPEDELFTECILTYNAEKDSKEDGVTDRETRPVQAEKRFEIIYVNHLSGQFTYAGKNIDDEWKKNTANTPGTDSAELLYAYNAAGQIQNSSDPVARIQFQSHVGGGTSADFHYLLLSDLNKLEGFPTENYGSDAYVLLSNASGNVTCRFNAEETLYTTRGRPSQVWGLRKTMAITQMNITEPDDLRKLIASKLAQASVPIRRGRYQVSKAPYYWLDGLVLDRTSGAPGDRIQVKNLNGSTPVKLSNYGIREGMLVHKMTADHAGIAQANSNDVYGYITNMHSNTHIDVDLTESASFSANDPIRIFIPLRAGDVIRVDNIVADVLGDHLITELDYSEYPNPTTQFQSIGKNEIRGGPVKKGNIISRLADPSGKEEQRQNTSVARSIQFASFDGTFGYSGNNTITWTTGNLRTSDGTTYPITNSTTSDTTHGLGSSGMTGTNKYILYVDPVGENPSTNATAGTAEVYHIKTVAAAGQSITPSYKQDADNIKIGSAAAGVNNASFFKSIDADGDPGKVEGTATIHNESMTTALLKKGARAWTTTLDIDGTAFNAIEWDAAQLVFANGDTVTLNAGSETGIAPGTHYMFINGVSGSLTPGLTTSHGGAIGDAKILLATVTVSAVTDGNKPTIFPFNGKKPTLSAVVLAADLIIADHIRTGTISADRFTSGTQTSITEKSITTVSDNPPNNPRTNDIWFDTGLDPVPIKVYTGSAWVIRNQNAPEGGSGATVFYAATSSPPTSNAVNDIWYATDTDIAYIAVTHPADQILATTEWVKQDVALAINSATTEIKGGLIDTQMIVLQQGGSSSNLFITGGEAFNPASSQSYIKMDYTAIKGISRSGTTDTTQFEIKAEDGKAYFAAGNIIGDSSGLHIKQSGSTKYLNFENSSGSLQSAIYTQDPITRWFTPNVGNTDPTSTGKEIVIGSGPDPQHPTNAYRDIPQTKAITLTAAYIGIHPKERTENDGPIYYQFPDSAPSDGQVLSRNGSTFTKTIAGDSSATIYPLDWVSVSGGGSYTHPDPIQLGSGSESAPTYSFSVQTGTGMFRTSGSVCLAADGDELLRCSDTYSKMYNYGKVYIQTMDSTSGGVYVKWEDGSLKQSSSTERSKMNIRDLDVDSTKIYDLVPKSFEFRTPQMVIEGEKHRNVVDENGRLLYTDTPESTSFGMVAEAVNEVLPELVLSAAADGLPDGVDYPMLSVLVLAELKKLRDRIEVLEGD